MVAKNEALSARATPTPSSGEGRISSTTASARIRQLTGTVRDLGRIGAEERFSAKITGRRVDQLTAENTQLRAAVRKAQGEAHRKTTESEKNANEAARLREENTRLQKLAVPVPDEDTRVISQATVDAAAAAPVDHSATTGSAEVILLDERREPALSVQATPVAKRTAALDTGRRRRHRVDQKVDPPASAEPVTAPAEPAVPTRPIRTIFHTVGDALVAKPIVVTVTSPAIVAKAEPTEKTTTENSQIPKQWYNYGLNLKRRLSPPELGLARRVAAGKGNSSEVAEIERLKAQLWVDKPAEFKRASAGVDAPTQPQPNGHHNDGGGKKQTSLPPWYLECPPGFLSPEELESAEAVEKNEVEALAERRGSREARIRTIDRRARTRFYDSAWV